MSSHSPSKAENLKHERLAQLTKTLCSISSVTGNEEEISEWLEAWFSKQPAYEMARVGKSFALRSTPRGRPILALVGHTDTVPPHPGDPPAHIQNMDSHILATLI